MILIGDLLDRPVVSRADGARLGMVREILVDVSRNRVVGYVLDMPISIGQARIIMAGDGAYAEDVVFVENEGSAKYVGQNPDLKRLIETGVGMSASSVTVGDKVVRLAEFAFDPGSAEIVGRRDGDHWLADSLEDKDVGLVFRPVEEYDGPGWESYARYVYDLDYSSLGL